MKIDTPEFREHLDNLLEALNKDGVPTPTSDEANADALFRGTEARWRRIGDGVGLTIEMRWDGFTSLPDEENAEMIESITEWVEQNQHHQEVKPTVPTEIAAAMTYIALYDLAKFAHELMHSTRNHVAAFGTDNDEPFVCCQAPTAQLAGAFSLEDLANGNIDDLDFSALPESAQAAAKAIASELLGGVSDEMKARLAAGTN